MPRKINRRKFHGKIEKENKSIDSRSFAAEFMRSQSISTDKNQMLSCCWQENNNGALRNEVDGKFNLLDVIIGERWNDRTKESSRKAQKKENCNVQTSTKNWVKNDDEESFPFHFGFSFGFFPFLFILISTSFFRSCTLYFLYGCTHLQIREHPACVHTNTHTHTTKAHVFRSHFVRNQLLHDFPSFSFSILRFRCAFDIVSFFPPLLFRPLARVKITPFFCCCNVAWRVFYVHIRFLYIFSWFRFETVFLFLLFSLTFFCCSSLNGPHLSPFAVHSNLNLYNHYASASYATYTSPQYTTANPNRCPSNTNDHLDLQEAENRKAKKLRKLSKISKLDNGNDVAVANNSVVAKNERRMLNETVIEEGHGDVHVSFPAFLSTIFHLYLHLQRRKTESENVSQCKITSVFFSVSSLCLLASVCVCA